MSIRAHQSLIALSNLSLWLFLLGSPWISLTNNESQKTVKTEQTEHEAEGEEWEAEWDETILASCNASNSSSITWQLANWHNLILHQRLDAARLLDPPDKKLG